MRSTCGVVLVLFLIKLAGAVPGEPVMYLPPFEIRTLDSGTRMFPFSSVPFNSANQRMMSQPAMSVQQQSPMSVQQQSLMMAKQQLPISVQQQSMMTMQQPTRTMPSSLLHTSSMPTSPEEPITDRPHDRHNFTLNEFVEVLNEITEHNNEERPESRAVEESPFSRAVEGKDGYPAPPPSPPFPPYQSYPPGSYQRPFASPGSYSYPPPPTSYAPPPHQAPKTVDLGGLLKPASTKVASKVSGLLGLILTLFTGSAPGDLLELTGFKDIIINGIVKPLLMAKGGIKTLISKLTIPVIALLLINVEVLITVWWLWEECPQQVSSKPSYNYNSYNSYPPSYHHPSS